MYRRSARFYDTVYAFKDYPSEARNVWGLIQARTPGARSLLDVACGTGQHIELLRDHFASVEGTDVNPVLLDGARKRCPGVPFHQADMTALDLGRTFDVVTCLFGSIGYVKTSENLTRAVAAMARHVAPGGLLLVEPWFTPEAFRTHTITANLGQHPDLKVAWMYTSEREGDLSILGMHYLVGTPDGVEHFTERHEIGLFSDRTYRDAFASAGFGVDFETAPALKRGCYVGAAPRS